MVILSCMMKNFHFECFERNYGKIVSEQTPVRIIFIEEMSRNSRIEYDMRGIYMIKIKNEGDVL